MSPAIFLAIFMIGMLHDIRRVVQQQGWPRLDLAVGMEQLVATMPPEAGPGSEEFQKWVEAAIDEISEVYASLEPDDAYVHTDIVAVNRPVGAVDSSSLGAVDGLIRGIERMVTRALKTMPLLMGLQEAGSETHANRQWELHAAGVKSVQHLLEAMLQKLLTIALRAQGLQATVQFRFAELRASEELRDAQTEQMKIENAKSKYEAGWISQDEASLEVTGHEADQEEPRRAAAPPPMVQGDGDGEPVANDEERWLSLLWGAMPHEARMQFLDGLRGTNGHKTTKQAGT
jgi:hypothetical protein